MYSQIIKRVENQQSVRLRKSHVSGWINGKHKPFGYVRAFNAVPTPELAYIIGVRLGDASMSVSKSYNYKIKLRVIDKEFAQEFSQCLSFVLGRSPPRVKWHEKTHSWHTELSSLLLQNFLRRPLDELKQTIEHNDACAAAFLRGFFDSEGWVYRFQLGVVNTDKILLLYVSHLLESRFDIHVGPPRVTSKGGRIVMIKGKFYNANKDCYNVPVSRYSLAAYQERVGFTMLRKQQRLIAAIRGMA